jgi:anti-sigma factor RsiW
MIMRCRGARRSLLAALDGELGTAEREALNTHLSGCEACRTAADETARLHRALAGMAQVADPPVSLESATLRRVRGVLGEEAHARAGFGGGGLWWWVAAPLAATLAGVLVWRSHPGGAPSGPALVEVPPMIAAEQRLAAGEAPNRRTEQAGSRPVGGTVRDESPEAPVPPPRVAEALDLFLEMPILENMEKLENFDAIRTVDVGEGTRTEDGRG